MHLSFLDWSIIALSILVCFIPALFYIRRAGKNTSEFFSSGHSAPWWLIGISMVATTFSADTPNLVTEIVRKNGIAGNWVWWAFLLTGMSTVFFYAKLWRRSGALTDLEFYELRYSGKAASMVRGFRSIYLGLLFNLVIMASVNLAAVKIASIVLGWDKGQTLLVCGFINILFAATSGLWGVLVIDLIQFGIAMTGAIALAYFALSQPEIGGLNGLVTQMNLIHPDKLNFMPDFNDMNTAIGLFILPIAIQWWSVWYPGSEPGGGSYIAQRMLAAKSERDALGGTLFFNIAHYAIRPWPWIIVALCSLIIFPSTQSIHDAFPNVQANLVKDDLAYPAMMGFLPSGWLGLMVAGLLAAYISTIITHLNWGTSYLVHDFYRRFIRSQASEKHYVGVGRYVTVLLMILSSILTFFLDSAKDTFDIMLSIGAGTGLLYLLRWFWWRINAWAEIVAMVVSFVVSVAMFTVPALKELPEWIRLSSSVGITTIAWVSACFLAPQTSEAVLKNFFYKIQPIGPGWGKYSEGLRVKQDESFTLSLLGWTAGVTCVWSGLFWSGSLIFGKPGIVTSLSGFLFLLSSGILIYIIPKMWGKK